MVLRKILAIGFIPFALGYPIRTQDVPTVNLALAAAFLLTGVVSVALCLCCKKRRDGFKEFNNPRSSNNIGFTNALATEVTVFPPLGASVQRQELALVPPVNSEPTSKPPGYSNASANISDWFTDQNGNFPRQQIFYQKEMGSGWFGKVMEGEVRGTKVAVRILKDGSDPEEKSHFLNEAKPFRDLHHKNIARLFGKCLEQEPYLLIFELYENRDLKNFLLVNSNSKDALFKQGICLKLMTDVSEGVNFMNKNGFIHLDLAARNCIVAPDLTVKIGDYGLGIDLYKNEYYHTGGIAVPIRWCAPETISFTSSHIETKQVTVNANVWSLAVILWEIAEFGKLPYSDLSDDEVISKVFGEEMLLLPQPNCLSGQYLYSIMQICWRMENRATTEQVISMLQYLKTNPFQESDFESRWRKLKPNTVPIVDNHTPIHSPRHTELAQRPKLQTKMEFDSGVDLEIKPSDENPDSCKMSTPMTISPQLSVTSEDIFQTSQKKSPSLTNLKGSLEDVQFDSWLQGVEQKTEEDRTFVKNISEAIKNLDETLALEKTSSSSADSSMECQKKPSVEFKLGPTSLERYEFGSDTEDETWRHRIERGEFTEKVKEKSKSVTDLMVLTHIDSEESENDSLPSLTRQYALKRNGTKMTTYTGIGFSSEGNIRNAILREELEEKLRSLTIWKNDDSSLLSIGKNSFLVKYDEKENKTAEENLESLLPISDKADQRDEIKTFLENEKLDSSKSQDEQSFLVKAASETTFDKIKNCDKTETGIVNSENVDSVNSKEVNVESSEAAYKNETAEKHSSQEDCVPKIIITESELQPEIEEPEEQVEVSFKPRKFVFICRESEDSDTESANESVQINQPEVQNEPDSKLESSVILGSCEEHTLDFFKGLKTTFSPSEQFSDEEVNVKDWPVTPIKEANILDEEDEPEQRVVKTEVKKEERFISPLNIDSPKRIKSDLKCPIQSALRQHNSKVSKSKSLDSGLSTEHKLSEIPVFNMAEYVSEEYNHNGSFDSYFSIDSGHSSERCIDQDKQMNDLKNRLEDVMKYTDDFQLRSSEDEYGGKLLTPDDERSSDSGFRDKGSLSESVEDTCDEKYNLEDIDAELDDYTLKSNDKDELKYYEQFVNETPQNIEGWFLHPKQESEKKENGWVSLSTEDEEQQVLTIDDEFVNAIRNELKEKLPCAQQTSKVEEESSPEQETTDSIQFTYPAQLSPILEEQESNQSSLVIDDNLPVLILPPVEPAIDTFKEDMIKEIVFKDTPDKDPIIIEDLEEGKEIILPSDNFPVEDDVIMIDTETNEVTLIESPKPQSHLAFVLPRKINENFKDDDSIGVNSETYILSPDNAPLSPDISIGSDTLSSPENNMSGLYMSPCSIRSDLFDSGPPSLPFDLGQSMEEVEEISIGKPNNEAVEIMQDLIDAGIIKKTDIVKDDELIEKDVSDPCSVEPACSYKDETEELIRTNFEDIKNEYVEESNNIQVLKYEKIEEKSNGTVESPDKSELKGETKDSTEAPVIVVEEETPKHKKAEHEIDLLLEKPMSMKNASEKELEKKKSDESWLKDLFFQSEQKTPEGELPNKNWPTSEELMSPSGSDEKGLAAKPNITSTLALLSPDVSSNDSKCQSLMSSFASTPTYEDTKLLQDSLSDSSKEYSVKATPTSLSIGTSSITVPMPSPEDAEKGWRPTICQLMELTDQAEGEEMTTSFIEPDENGTYTPDWESDTSDDHSSSSSGEFVWKEGDKDELLRGTADTICLLQEPSKMERIDEEEENTTDTDDDTSSEESGTEFVPSTWNPNATPIKSSLKSPNKVKSEGKRVVFEKEKYQCVYKYPREEVEEEEEINTQASSFSDYSTFGDWDLGDVEIQTANEPDSDIEDQGNTKKHQDYDFYRLNYNMGPHLITDDGEFYISSSSRAFDWSDSDGSEFFPGRESEEIINFSPNASDLTPLNLGELRHTKDTLRLELPTLIRHSEKAEACVLDSGIDTASPQQEK
ncbi:uncharacterized protein LOC106668161 isoform X2 [Cimex lectularius]|uniref:Protein kinase domain-containing protein n=1 Tax=Cimex lectularius TaxID=79782 RepID=A0A8I6RY35_CIMLE|nr:uncharacterized protein LOC106668161 isoform X2 [Cimex lectularius]